MFGSEVYSCALRTVFLWLSGVGCSIPIAFCLVMFAVDYRSFTDPYQTWYAVGPVQVLGGPDEVWIFAEKRTMIRIPGMSASAPVRSQGHVQEVVVFDAKGEKRRTTISKPSPTFHTNISRVFRKEDDFYLIKGESMGYHRSLFRWSETQFELMPLGESEAWLEQVGLKDKLPESDPALDRITEKNGWKHLYDDKAQLGIKEESFAWNGLRLQFKVDQGPIGKYRLVSLDQGNPLDITLFEFDQRAKDISRKELDGLHPDPIPGHKR